MPQILWSPSSDANASSSSSSQLQPPGPPPALAFQLSLPTSLTYDGKEVVLPPTYAGKEHINYMVEVIVKRGFLHSDLRQLFFRYGRTTFYHISTDF
ncbi:hypothetical protein DL93DRAFT_2079350 [Clavulina sp. PMI_390]|nr:hypothetical protein DL93DRAFT_2079350 [Clavulina sp. PMI_390]